MNEFKEKIKFNFWSNIGLIATSNSGLRDSELELNFKMKEIKTHLLNVLTMRYCLAIYKLLILNEQGLTTPFKIKANSNLKFITITFS